MAGGGKQVLGKIPAMVIYLLILVLSSSASFGLGILAGKDMAKGQGGGFEVQNVLGTSTLPAAAVAAPESAPQLPAGGQYVASKSGTRYYLPWCSGAKQIKEENKVWFTSKEDAESKGYTPAKNCKGI